MRFPTAATLALTILLVTSSLGAVAATPSATADSEQTAVDRTLATPVSASESHVTPSVAANKSPLPAADPEQIIRIDVEDDGDARWTIESRFLLTDERANETFDEYASAVTAGQRPVEYHSQQFEPFVAAAERSTGREMEIVDSGWDEPRVEPAEDDEFDADEFEDDHVRVGTIAYSFTWTNFATVDNDRIYVGDVFQTADGGTWLTLGEGQRLVIENPPNYGLETPTPLSWDGPHQFDADDLEIVFLRGAGQLITDQYIVGVLVLLLVAGAAGYYLARSRNDGLPFDLPAPGRSADAPGEAGASSQSGTEASSADELTADPDDAGTHLEYEEESGEEIDPELLSDEERVRRLLEQNGGRMKQATIVTETGWSNAKVSQLLSQMDDDDEIEKLRIGRENLITLPGVDPTDTE